ncbi:hypothetical protein [Burkholderia contaminans]|uniref:hypothetical protein n=1 Tax=Burkholderia contaminans TaxID=488447 RepID=UPI00311948ED
MKNTRQRLARSGKHGCSMETGTGVGRAAGWDVTTRSADTTARDGAGFGRSIQFRTQRIDNRRAFKVD